jgi:hypothetical protein
LREEIDRDFLNDIQEAARRIEVYIITELPDVALQVEEILRGK